ncbi:MAG: cation:proton antiporter [Anderseniella sp.]|jgi:Kef-type K+ transport system membrane component KefB|nr:cation:proton antiporter [Anderseniella sp.]
MELIYILMVLLVVTRIFGEVAERVGQPAIAGELVAGIILGVTVSLFSDSLPVLADVHENEVFIGITDLAIFFLMLFAGVELSPRKLAKSSQGAVLVALGGFLLPLALGFGLAWIYLPQSDYKMVQSLFVGTAMAITAVPVAVKILMDLGKLESEPGQMIVSAALFDDILSLVLLAALVAVIQTGTLPGASDLAILAFKIAAFFAITGAIGVWIVPRISHLISKAKAQEFELSVLLMTGFAYAFLAEELGLHFILGAFVAGLFFRRSKIEAEVYESVSNQLSGITSGFLAPIFFASIGLNLDLSALTEIPVFLTLLIIVAFAGKLAGSGLVAYLQGMNGRDASAVGFAMSGRGAVELIIADIALRGGIFQLPDPPPPVVSNLFSAVVIVAVVTTVITPLALRRTLGKRGNNAD